MEQADDVHELLIVANVRNDLPESVPVDGVKYFFQINKSLFFVLDSFLVAA